MSADQPQLPPDVNQGPWYLAVDWVLRGTAILIVALRLYTRRIAKDTAGWDDVFIFFAALASLAGGIATCIKVAHGFGRHAVFLSPEDLEVNATFLPMAQLCNFIDLFFSRASVCFFILRLLPKTQKWPQRTTWAVFVLNLLSSVASCLVFSLQCKPTTTTITRTQSDGCVAPDQLRTGLAVAGVVSVLVDVMSVALPLLVIRNLQMTRRTKLSISVVMSLGLLTAACSIGKLLSVRHIVDPTWDGVPVSVWGSFEENCAIIFASAPAIRQLFKVLRGRRHTSPPPTNQRYGDSRGYGDSRMSSAEKGASALVRHRDADLDSEASLPTPPGTGWGHSGTPAVELKDMISPAPRR